MQTILAAELFVFTTTKSITKYISMRPILDPIIKYVVNFNEIVFLVRNVFMQCIR